MSTYLVTGGAGFIGHHLVGRLLRDGHKVRVLDDLSTGNAARIPANVEFQQGSVTDADERAKALKDLDGVFHLAAVVSIQESIQNWEWAHRVNLIASAELFREAGQLDIPVVYASSAAVYGDQSGQLCEETQTIPQPISPYGADKLAAEHQAYAAAQVNGLRSMGLRFFNVYGPGQSNNSPYSGVIARFLKNAQAGKPHHIYGDGTQTRDFIHVSDVVSALISAMGVLDTTIGANICNVATGTSYSLLYLANAFEAAFPGSGNDIIFAPKRQGDISHSRASIKRQSQLLGSGETITLEEGLLTLISESSAAA